MHILIVANISPFETGGAEVQVRSLVEFWLQKGHNVTIAGNRIPSCIIKSSLSRKDISCIHIPTITSNLFTRAFSYSISLSLYILRYKGNFDLIYCRFLREAALIISSLKVLRLTSLPLIACPACSGPPGDAQFLKQLPATNFLIALLNKGCSAINSISPQIHDELTQLGISEKIFSLIPNGVNKPLIFKNTFNKPGNRSFVFVGRLTEQKGLVYLLKALHKLKKRINNVCLTIIGEGPDRLKLESMASKLDINENVIFCGLVTHDEINNHLFNHDFFVLPSLSEGHPNALLEAMAIGLPAIVTRCGGSEYFVDNSVGRVVQAGDVNSLANSLLEMLELSNEELQNMSLSAQKRVSDKFNIESIADRNIQLFKQYI